MTMEGSQVAVRASLQAPRPGHSSCSRPLDSLAWNLPTWPLGELQVDSVLFCHRLESVSL